MPTVSGFLFFVFLYILEYFMDNKRQKLGMWFSFCLAYTCSGLDSKRVCWWQGVGWGDGGWWQGGWGNGGGVETVITAQGKVEAGGSKSQDQIGLPVTLSQNNNEREKKKRKRKRKPFYSRCNLCTAVTPATGEAETGGFQIASQPWKPSNYVLNK